MKLPCWWGIVLVVLMDQRGFFGGGGSAPRPAPATPAPVQETDVAVQQKRAARRYKAGLEGGYQSTIATSPMGTSQAPQATAGTYQKLG
jgi:hypothetical protein